MKLTNLALTLILFALVACTVPASTSSSSTDLTGTYTGSSQVKAVRSDNTEFFSGKLELRAAITSAASLFTTNITSAFWKGSDVTLVARAFGLQGSTQNTVVAIVVSAIGCSSVLLKGSSTASGLVFPAGSSALTCGFQSGTISWAAFTLERQ